MLKKILIIMMSVFVLFGCSKKGLTPVEETDFTPIIYETNMSISTYDTIDIFDGIYLSNLIDLQNYQKKTSIFDLDKAKSIQVIQIPVRSSDSGYNAGYANSHQLYEVYSYFEYIETIDYLDSYLVTDFSEYMTQDFLDDMQKLEENLLTPDELFNTYGTHAVVAVRNGFKVRLELTVESRELAMSEFSYISNLLMHQRPLTFPITDASYLLYQSKSRISFDIFSTHEYTDLSEFFSTDISTYPLAHLITLNEVLPLYRVFGLFNETYPNAIDQLEVRYQELFPRFSTN